MRPAPLSTGNPLLSVADPESNATPPAIGSYGPLWSFSRAAKYSNPKPAGGYLPFATSDWPKLYPAAPAAPAAKSGYPADGTPYLTLAYQTAPAGNTGVAQRRLLHIALLACPLPAGSDVLAQVRGIGRFFMTAPASNGVLSAEFAGLATEGSAGRPGGAAAMRPPCRAPRRQGGVAAIELALILLFFMGLLPFVLLFGRALLVYTALQKSAHDAARYMATMPLPQMAQHRHGDPGQSRLPGRWWSMRWRKAGRTWRPPGSAWTACMSTSPIAAAATRRRRCRCASR